MRSFVPCVPCGHAISFAIPMFGTKYPSAARVQDICPATLARRPLLQFVQSMGVVNPADTPFLPTGQFLHSAARIAPSSSKYVFSGQSWHNVRVVDPWSGPYFPVGQRVPGEDK